MDEEAKGLVLQVDCSAFRSNRNFSWRRSKRFKYGSLLIFSADGFANFGTAIVRNADHLVMDKRMRRFGKCEIFVEVVDSQESVVSTFHAFRRQKLVVLESRAYFEAFSHTLETLKEMTVVPFASVFRGEKDFSLEPPGFLYEPYRFENGIQVGGHFKVKKGIPVNTLLEAYVAGRVTQGHT